MTQIRPNSRGGVIRWDKDDWLAGMSPFAQLSPTGTGMLSPYSIVEGKGFSFAQGIDPYRNPGLLSPGFNETALTHSDTVDAFVTGFCNYGTNAYLTTYSPKVFHLDIVGESFDASVYKTLTHGAHSGILGDDAVYYKAKVSSTNTLCRFYSFNDNTDGAVMMDNAGTLTIVTGSDSLSKDFLHPMIVGTDDVLYIGNGSSVASFDGQVGTDGQFTLVKFQLPTDYVINSFQNLSNYLVIFANKKTSTTAYASESTVFFWDKVSADPTYKFNVDTFFISASFQYGSTVGCFGVGGSGAKAGGAGFVKLFLYDGTKFDLIKNMPIAVSAQVPRNGVLVLDETIYFTSLTGNLGSAGVATGAIFSYGKDFLGKWSLNCIAQTANTGGSFLESFQNGNFYVEKEGHTPIKLYTDYTTGRFITPMVQPPLPPEQRARIRKLKVGWGQNSNGGRAFELYLNTNKGNNRITVDTGIGASPKTITDANLLTNYLKDVNGQPLGKYFFESISLEGLYTTGGGASGIPPLLEFVELFYDVVKI